MIAYPPSTVDVGGKNSQQSWSGEYAFLGKAPGWNTGESQQQWSKWNAAADTCPFDLPANGKVLNVPPRYAHCFLFVSFQSLARRGVHVSCGLLWMGLLQVHVGLGRRWRLCVFRRAGLLR